MKNIIPFILGTFLLSTQIIAQTYIPVTGKVIEKETPHYTDYSFIARDQIILKPGFSINGTAGNELQAYIDESLIFNADYLAPGDIPNVNTRTIDKSLPVGTIPGVFEVSNSGAANYIIPIELPAGINGIKPNISIAYNSQGGNGLLGMGWSLEGFSKIMRGGSNIYFNNLLDPLDFDDNDNFFLDGNRLHYDNTTGKFITTNTTFEDIELLDGNITNPGSFMVRSRSGDVMLYGNTNDSKIELQNNPKAVMWYANMYRDVNSNEMVYKYHENKTTGESYPLSIEYAKKSSGVSDNYKVKFIYENARNDKQVAYIAGYTAQTDVLLRKIKIYKGDKLVKAYQFNYKQDHFSKLVEIQEFGADEIALNSTIIDWGNKGTPMTHQYTLPNSKDNHYLSGDFDGDGLADLIFFEKKEKLSSTDTWKFYKGNLNNFFTYVCSTPFPQAVTVAWLNDKPFQATMGLSSNDVDGDGIDDVILKLYYDLELTNECPIPPTSCQYIGYIPYKWNGSSFDQEQQITNHNANAKSFFADFDGNGTIEWDEVKEVRPEDANYNFDFYLLDFNGDSKADILEINPTQGANPSFKIYDSDNFNTVLFASNELKADHKLKFGDFNGDGKTDILDYHDNGLEIFYSTGTGFINKPLIVIIRMLNYETDSLGIHVADYNGDGLSDFVLTYDVFEWQQTPGGGKGSPPQDVKVGIATYVDAYFSKGVEFSAEWHDLTLDEIETLDSKAVSADFNGDGKAEIFFTKGKTDGRTIFFHKNDKSNLVKAIADGHNNTTNIYYDLLTSQSGVYTPESNAPNANKVYDVRLPYYVVSAVEVTNATTELPMISYSYKGAKFNKQGLGFLGFSEIKRKESGGHAFVWQKELLVNNNYCLLQQKSTKTYNTAETIIINEDILTNQVHHFQGRVVFPYISQSVSKNNLTGEVITKTFAYSTADLIKGNLTSLTINYNGIASDITNYYYENPIYNIFRVDYEINTKTRTNVPGEYKSKTDYSYWHPQKKGYDLVNYYVFNNGAYQLFNTIDYVYGADYNISSESVIADGITRTKSYTYTSDGRIKTETDILGNTTEYTYDGYNRLIRKYDQTTKLKTEYAYNARHSCINTTFSDGSIQNTSVSYNNGADQDAPTSCLYIEKTQTTASPDVFKYYNGMGLLLREKTFGRNNIAIFKDHTYNNKLQLTMSTDRYFRNQTSYLKHYTQFDEYGRLQYTYIDSHEKKIQYFYGSGVNTVTKRIQSTGEVFTKTYDATGVIVSAQDFGGTIYYQYTPSGKVSRITDAFGAVTQITYDRWGAQDLLITPNAGTTNYDYNKFGELVRQVDNKGNEIIQNYSANGLLQTTTTSAGTTISYTYDNVFVTKPKTITRNNGTSEEFVYNNLGFISEQSVTVDGEKYTTKYTYDNNNRLNSLVYPSNFKLTYNYEGLGYLSSIRRDDNGSYIWQNATSNAKGQFTEYYLGSLKTEKGYDKFGMPELIKTGNIQHLTFDFNDITGNLTSRADIIHNQSESFTYENNRLKTITGSNSSIINYRPDGSGRIDNKTNIGTYNYLNTGNAGPHAITGIDGNPENASWLNQTMTYNEFNKLSVISEPSTGNQQSFTYGPSGSRCKSVIQIVGKPTLTRKYLGGGYELEQTANGIVQKHYIPVGSSYALLTIDAAGNKKLNYLLTDYLGSVLTAVNTSGVVEEEYSFDAWGRPRNPNNWLYTGMQEPTITNKGYTGHEHMLDFNLINMNGRVYDPALGLFLSPDPYVQAPDFTQNFNSYAYCFNNPFSYTDPSGEIVQVLLYGALIGAGYGGLSYGMSLAGTGNSFNWNSFGTSVLRGAVSGALSAGFANIVGAAFPNAGGFGYELGRGLSHGVSQGLVSKIYGESFKSGFASGLASSFMGSYTATSGTMATRILEASAAGGFSAYIMGGDWKLGAMQGAIVQYFNHERHRPEPGEEWDPIINIETSLEAGAVIGAKFKLFGIGAEVKGGVSKKLLGTTLREGNSLGGDWEIKGGIGAGPLGLDFSKAIFNENGSIGGNFFFYNANMDIQSIQQCITILDISASFGLGGSFKISMPLEQTFIPSRIDDYKIRVDNTYVKINYE